MTFGYPPGPMSGRGGPFDDGCPCLACPFLNYKHCDCEGKVCDSCGKCAKHCRCYDDGDDAGEEAAEVEPGDVLDALSPERETLEWDTGADGAPRRHAPIRRAGGNYWVTRDLANPWPGEEGMYFEEQRWADQTPPKVCPNQHEAHFKPTVGTHVCQECGLIYIGGADQWIAPSR